MAGSVDKTWDENEILTANDLNGEFINAMVTQDQNIGTPRKVGNAWDMNGEQLIMDALGTSHLTADTNGRLDLALGGTDLFRWDGTTASSITGLDFIAGITAVPVQIAATGETDVSVNIVPAGTGDLQVSGGSMSPLAWQVYGA